MCSIIDSHGGRRAVVTTAAYRLSDINKNCTEIINKIGSMQIKAKWKEVGDIVSDKTELYWNTTMNTY